MEKTIILTGFQPIPKHAHCYITVKTVYKTLSYTWKCLDCQGDMAFEATDETVSQTGGNKMKVVCPQCKAVYYAKCEERKVNITDKPIRRKVPAALVYGGRFGGLFNAKTERLYQGHNLVGRNDADSPSDINIDDPYVSRQSADIFVAESPDGEGHTFKMKVLSASNPVFVNSQQVREGDFIYLNYNDKIKLGHTVLALKRIEIKNK